jgi:hypothetical protein
MLWFSIIALVASGCAEAANKEHFAFCSSSRPNWIAFFSNTDVWLYSRRVNYINLNDVVLPKKTRLTNLASAEIAEDLLALPRRGREFPDETFFFSIENVTFEIIFDEQRDVWSIVGRRLGTATDGLPRVVKTASLFSRKRGLIEFQSQATRSGELHTLNRFVRCGNQTDPMLSFEDHGL